MVQQNDFQILMNIGTPELKLISKFPEEMAVEFFELLEIKDITNFSKERT